jgi:hypothetical protein
MLVASFARPTGMFDNWFNRFTAFVTGGSYCHSEFVFTFPVEEMKEFLVDVGEEVGKWEKKLEKYEDEGNVHICFFVVWGEQVNYRLLKKNHTNPYCRYPVERDFSVIEMDVTKEETVQLAKFLMQQRKKEYDYVGALTFYVPFRTKQEHYSMYFCSQLMVNALQHVNKFMDVNPSGVTPNKLYNMLLLS